MGASDRTDDDDRAIGPGNVPVEARSAPSLADPPASVRAPGSPAALPTPAPDASAVPADVTRAFIAQPDVRRVVRRRIRRRVGKLETVSDLLQTALAEATAAAEKSPPVTAQALPGWLYTIADRTVANHYKVRARRAPYEGTVEDPDAVAVEPDEAPGFVSWYIAPWITKQVAGNAREEEFLDVLIDKAVNEKSWEDIARERETTTKALKGQLTRFKKKYVPRWRRARTLLLAGAILLIALACAAAYVIVDALQSSGPDRTGPRLPAVPTSTATNPPVPTGAFDPATGPTERTPDKPTTPPRVK